MDASVFFPLFLVLVDGVKNHSIFYLSADLQKRSMFRPRAPLSANARRAGWQGFIYEARVMTRLHLHRRNIPGSRRSPLELSGRACRYPLVVAMLPWPSVAWTSGELAPRSMACEP
jgi:hypothetical protein